MRAEDRKYSKKQISLALPLAKTIHGTSFVLLKICLALELSPAHEYKKSLWEWRRPQCEKLSRMATLKLRAVHPQSSMTTMKGTGENMQNEHWVILIDLLYKNKCATTLIACVFFTTIRNAHSLLRTWWVFSDKCGISTITSCIKCGGKEVGLSWNYSCCFDISGRVEKHHCVRRLPDHIAQTTHILISIQFLLAFLECEVFLVSLVKGRTKFIWSCPKFCPDDQPFCLPTLLFCSLKHRKDWSEQESQNALRAMTWFTTTGLQWW